jgi:cyclopropane fatty-acyl-phospholipid synthase-like methyltransferase
MPAELAPFHRDLVFMAPLSEERANALVGFLAANLLSGLVVDVGCGWAELLLRVLEASPRSWGLGIDLEPESIEHAMNVARERHLSDRLTLVAGDAKEKMPMSADAVICIGASQIWGLPVEARAPLNYGAALSAIRSVVEPGAPVIYGEGIWTATPTDAAIAPLANRRDEYLFLPDLLDLADKCGFACVQTHQASLDEWDAFESGYTARYARWLSGHRPDHPNAREICQKAQGQRAAYFRGYRGVLGMAYLAMLAI